MTKKRRLRFWHLAIAGVLAVITWGWITAVMASRNAKAHLERELAAVRALGFPTTPAEMRSKIDINENAASDYRRAKATMKGHGPVNGLPSAALYFADAPGYRQWVEANKDTLAIVESAAKKPACDFGRAWEQGPSLTFPELADMEAFVKLVIAQAHYDAATQDFRASFHWLGVGSRICVHAREPVLLTQLVSGALEALVLRELQLETHDHGHDTAFRERARMFLSSMPDLPSLREGLKGDMFMAIGGIAMMENSTANADELRSSIPDAKGNRLWEWQFRLPGILQEAEAKIVESYRRVIEKIGSDPNDYRSAVNAFREGAVSRDESVSGRLAAIFFLDSASPGSAVAGAEARRRLARCGVELYEVKSKTGAFPQSLPKEKWATDPFTEQPFVYKPSSKGFILYSLGMNLKDDGGKPRYPKAGTTTTDDVEFFAPRP